jgi:hypothetical protein
MAIPNEVKRERVTPIDYFTKIGCQLLLGLKINFTQKIGLESKYTEDGSVRGIHRCI